MIKMVQYQCPLCGEWINYGSAGRFDATLLSKRASDATWAWKAMLYHLRTKHFPEIDELFPRENKHLCPICGKQVAPLQTPWNRYHQSMFAQHLFVKHFAELAERFKEKYGKMLAPEGWEKRIAEVDEAPMLARWKAQAELRKARAAARKKQKEAEQAAQMKESSPPVQVAPSPQVEEKEPVPPPVVEQPTQTISVPHPVVEPEQVTSFTVPTKEEEKMPEPGPEKIPEEPKTTTNEPPQEPEETIPEGFEKKSIFDFLKERVEPFHRRRGAPLGMPKKKEKQKAKKRFNFASLMPFALVGGILFLLWQSQRQKVSQLTSQAQAPSANTPTEVPSQSNSAPTPRVDQQVELPGHAVIDDEGRFHSRKYPDKKIL